MWRRALDVSYCVLPKTEHDGIERVLRGRVEAPLCQSCCKSKSELHLDGGDASLPITPTRGSLGATLEKILTYLHISAYRGRFTTSIVRPLSPKRRPQA